MIDTFFALVPTGLTQGLIIAFVALGVMVPFRLLNFPDLTSEGTFPLGGCFCAILLIHGYPPITALLLAAIAGGIMGIFTAGIHISLRVNTLLCGIIVSTILYSINLRLMGKPNLALFNQESIFSFLADTQTNKTILLLALNIIVITVFYQFLKTEKGLRFRAVGLNPTVAMHQGTHLTLYTFFGLFLGNALNGFSGALMVQIQGYADVGMGVGIIIQALAAMMLGETLIGTQKRYQLLLAPFVGALVYLQIQGLVMALGLQPSDFKLVTGVIVLLTLSIQLKRSTATKRLL
ncbi:MAG: transporter permease [Gammaproteobacteria bacterium]|jgi:putative ABC transport system permease protein|nr:transporter permease [Gammaproteobacteria bacterium]